MNALEVVDGTGSGVYNQNAVVPISAISPLPGAKFQHWSGDGAIYVADVNATPTTLTMPASNTWVASTWLLTNGETYTGNKHSDY